ncbi:MAG: CehA/McbA family metallohydrolase [Planctomycetaceae bacterium]|nr:CehA/McbA family metallohydrolase [Planctomycetaceae bacterium]
MAKYDYKGVIHCHSTYSDGNGDMEEIGKAANAAGLDFVMMTDHDQMKPIEDGQEKWNESSLIICGTEITPDKNHFIVFGEKKLKDVDKLRALKPQEYIDAVNAQGWFGFIAHPDHIGTSKFGIPSYRWEDWNVSNYTGMGLWDLMTDWQSQLDREDVSMEVYTEFEDWLSGPRIETLKRWDALNLKGKVVGIGEIDNHKYKKDYNGHTLEIFPYETAFKTITNHILLDKPLDKDFKKAKKQVLEAVRHGALYVSFDWWDDPTEFSFEIDNGKKIAGMGDTIELGEKTELVASFPQEGLLNVYKNGESILEEEGDEILVDLTEPGAYRVEAMRNDIVWILSNNIYVQAAK